MVSKEGLRKIIARIAKENGVRIMNFDDYIKNREDVPTTNGKTP